MQRIILNEPFGAAFGQGRRAITAGGIPTGARPSETGADAATITRAAGARG